MTDEVVAVVVAHATRIAESVPSARWYTFGSMIRGADTPADYDVAVICSTDQDVALVRRELRSLCASLPLHLFLATEDEEQELGFVVGQGCKQIFPCDSISDEPGSNTERA
jgi:predicted nucleotidyltransferase